MMFKDTIEKLEDYAFSDDKKDLKAKKKKKKSVSIKKYNKLVDEYNELLIEHLKTTVVLDIAVSAIRDIAEFDETEEDVSNLEEQHNSFEKSNNDVTVVVDDADTFNLFNETETRPFIDKLKKEQLSNPEEISPEHKIYNVRDAIHINPLATGSIRFITDILKRAGVCNTAGNPISTENVRQCLSHCGIESTGTKTVNNRTVKVYNIRNVVDAVRNYYSEKNIERN